MTMVPYFINFESIHTLKNNFTKCYCHIYRTHKQTNKHTKHAFKLLVKWLSTKVCKNDWAGLQSFLFENNFQDFL